MVDGQYSEMKNVEGATFLIVNHHVMLMLIS